MVSKNDFSLCLDAKSLVETLEMPRKEEHTTYFLMYTRRNTIIVMFDPMILVRNERRASYL